MSASDIEAQLALARDYRPLSEGPLVSQKKSSQAITEEYAKADPVYVAKTAILPQFYSHYRSILGDGNCGWRAVGFAYFETFLRQQNKARIEEEITRMNSLSNLLITAGGFQQWCFEDMVMETIELLKSIAEYVETNPQEAENILMERFNKAEISNAIIYHFRLLASSWLKANPADYEGFILDGNGVEAYSKNYIEPVNLEIEHLIMSLLIDVLLKPIGIAVEIVYLDRTPGSHANTHLIQPEDPVGVPTNPGGPVIHLLFRPSHYDILYQDQPALVPLLNSPSNPTNVQANRAFTQQYVAQSTPADRMADVSLDTSLLSCLPGFSMPASDAHLRQAPIYPVIPAQAYTSSVGNTAPVSPGASPTHSVSSGMLSPSYSIPMLEMTSSPLHSPVSSFPQTKLPIHTDPPKHHRPSPFPYSELQPRSQTSSFRPSKYEYVAACDRQEGHMAFQTPTFKNSHYNTAHYNNVNFQPEQWEPDSDEASASRKRSSR
ncbi:hypothetical protein K3495_g5231 [Podosphaera aphanis]|nr:hypothetical protein K3495_g5231 [Podosphaera aphanis]